MLRNKERKEDKRVREQKQMSKKTMRNYLQTSKSIHKQSAIK